MPRDPLCPFCGAYSIRSCDFRDEEGGGPCPWEDMDDEPDPDRLLEDAIEKRRLARETPDAG